MRLLPSRLPIIEPLKRFIFAALFAAAALVGASSGPAAAQEKKAEAPETSSDGPIRLRLPALTASPSGAATNGTEPTAAAPAYVPGEFEKFVQRQASALVPAEYIVAPGDEILLTVWGAVDADLRLTVDRSGRIAIPRIGILQVAGVRYGDLQEVVTKRMAQQFRNFQLSVSLGQLRGIRVFVTGQVVRPGAYTVTSLSTVASALLRAGGPSAAGSYRKISLIRNGKPVGGFDIYDLLLKGDRSADLIVQAGDVVHVDPVGTQVGMIGSVNNPAVIEILPGETVADALRYAGGFSAVADRTRMAVERLSERNIGRVTQLQLPANESLALQQGDVLRAFSAVDVALPTLRQSKRVKVEGEVLRPAEYVLPEGSTVQDAIRAAGGFTPSAFVFATEFERVSVQLSQQANYDRALRDLETDLARTSSSQRVNSSEEAMSVNARSVATARLVERLRGLKPTGRIVLQLSTDARELPDLALEDGDRLYVPARPTTVGVFGSVFNAATYLYLPGRTLNDYLRLAGGTKKGADEESVFVVRANGNVVSQRQSSGWFNNRKDLGAAQAEPGDTIFVPEEMDKTSWVQGAKDWTQILYQFGLGLAGIRSAMR
jgi:protein involved in polysaccharide export with SLBB domain